MTQTYVYNPDEPFVSFWRALKEFVTEGLDTALYDIVFGFPEAKELQRLVPLGKTLIHFEIDEMPEQRFGFGKAWVNEEFDEAPVYEVVYHEARPHEIRMSLGIWASAESGGVTSRLEARQILDNLLNGPAAREDCMAATDGIEILSISGGRNFTDAVGDIPVWRMVDIELRLRIFSRKKTVPSKFIDEALQEPGVEIDETVIVG
jgi:hypothetical protein